MRGYGECGMLVASVREWVGGETQGEQGAKRHLEKEDKVPKVLVVQKTYGRWASNLF